MIVDGGVLRLAAEAKIGTELAKMPRAKGTRGKGRPKLGTSISDAP
jgi:hypothetical protein